MYIMHDNQTGLVSSVMLLVQKYVDHIELVLWDWNRRCGGVEREGW
jgi:hypothetical protein